MAVLIDVLPSDLPRTCNRNWFTKQVRHLRRGFDFRQLLIEDEFDVAVMAQPLAINESALQSLRSSQCRPNQSRFDEYFRILNDPLSPSLGDTCRQLAYSEFVPWMSPQNVANKIHFASNGGLKLLARLVEASLAEHERNSSALMTLLSAASALWNFPESPAMYDAMWTNGAVSALVDCVLHSTNARVLRVGIGALFGVLEQPDGPWRMMERHPGLSAQLVTIASALLGEVRTPYDMERALYGCLSSLAGHPSSRSSTLSMIVSANLVPTLVSVHSGDALARFLHAVLVAEMIFANEHENEHHAPLNRKKADELKVVLTQHMKMMSPSMLKEVQGSRGLVWSSLYRFTQLLHSFDPVVASFGGYVVASAVTADYHAVTLSFQEKDYLCALKWHDNINIRNLASEICDTLDKQPKVAIEVESESDSDSSEQTLQRVNDKIPMLRTLVQMKLERLAASDDKFRKNFVKVCARLGVETVPTAAFGH